MVYGVPFGTILSWTGFGNCDMGNNCVVFLSCFIHGCTVFDWIETFWNVNR